MEPSRGLAIYSVMMHDGLEQRYRLAGGVGITSGHKQTATGDGQGDHRLITEHCGLIEPPT